VLKDRVHSRRRLLGLAGAAALLASAGAAPASALTGSTATNPASSALAPVSKQAQSAAGAVGTPAGSLAVKPGAVGTPAGSLAVKPGAGTPTVTYVPQTATPLAGTRTTTITAAAPPAARKSATSTSTAAIVLAAIAALLALASLAWAIARWQAFEPHWVLSMRHATSEAGYRASATWAEFTDWVRLGR
jgi:hypothetical protein